VTVRIKTDNMRDKVLAMCGTYVTAGLQYYKVSHKKSGPFVKVVTLVYDDAERRSVVSKSSVFYRE